MMKFTDVYNFACSLAPISQESWEEFEQYLLPVTYKKSEFLLRPGENNDTIYLVLKGITRNFFVTEDGKEFTKIFRGPMGMVGPYKEILLKEKSTYFIQAITPVELLKFSYRNFENMMNNHHSWERLGRIVAEQNFLEKEKKEFMLMHMDIESKYKTFLEDFEAFKNEIPQYQIASYLGVSPEALNRFLKKK